MEEKESPLEREHTLVVVLPGGLEKTTTVHGSKPVMDLLVTLCAKYHLNPSEHHVDLLSANSNQITFKPNSPIGGLEAERIILKPKESEKARRIFVPEATVRLLINYRKSHKTVVRVNPRVPLENLLPTICQKCEFDVESTVLLKDSISHEPLDLSLSLNSHGVRELFAKDTAAVASPIEVPPSPTPEDVQDAPLPNIKDKELKKLKEKENKGFFSLFKRRKNKNEKGASVSAPVSPGLSQRPVNTLGSHASNTLPLDAPKKRRAPPPPMTASCSVPANLNASHLASPLLGSPLLGSPLLASPLLGSPLLGSAEGQASGLSRVSSTDSSDSCLRRTKRRAPPPPPPPPPITETNDTHIAEPEASLSTVEEQREYEDISPAPAVSHPREHVDRPAPNTDSSVGAVEPHAHLSLAEILTSSLGHRPSARPWSLASSSSTDSLSSQPRHSVGFPPAAGFPIRLRATPTGGTWRGGLTTFRVEPRGSLLRQRALEQELVTGASSGAQRIEDLPGSPAPPPDPPASCLERLSSPNPERPNPLSHVQTSPSTSGRTSSPSSSRSSPPSSPSSSTVLCGSDPQPGLVQEPEEQLESRGTPVSSASEEEAGQGTVLKTSETRDTSEEDEGYRFPPPPPPIFFEMKGEGSPPEGDSTSPPSPSARPLLQGTEGEDALAPDSSPRLRRPCLAKLLKRTGTVPSRFAQAVALAVQRSQLGPRDQDLPPGTGPCPAPATLPHANMVPEWLPCSSLNGSSCLG